jgi:hypothetical protein
MLLYGTHRSGGPSTSNLSGRFQANSGTTLTASATPHALSDTYTTLMTPTHDCWSLSVLVWGTSTGAIQTDMLINIYKGGAGSEVPFISNLAAGWTVGVDTGPGRYYWFPVYIPANTRLSAKCQAVIISDTVNIIVTGYGGGLPPHWVGQGVETLGANTAASQGTSITPGTSADGTFVNIGTTTARYGYVLPMMHGNMADTAISTGITTLDLGVGDSPLSGLSDFSFGANANEWIAPHQVGRFCDIPAGVVLQARAQASATAEDRDYLVYGVY